MMATKTSERVLRVESTRLRRRADWSAALRAGLGAGVAMAVWLVARLAGDSLWAQARRTAALILGPGVLPPPATYEPAIVLAAMVVHAFLSAVFALPLADAVYRLERRAAMPLGALYGGVLYALNFHAFTLLFPWFAADRGGTVLVAHLLYGLAVAFFYDRLERSAIR